MTQQVRSAYRRNPKRAWGVALALAVAAAVIAIPFASSAGPNADKKYTLSTSPLALCSGDRQVLTITLQNTSKTVQLGSAEVRLPGTEVEAGQSPTITSISPQPNPVPTPIVREDGVTILLEGLALPAPRGNALGGSVTFTVSVLAKTGTPSGPITAVAKQSNSFNDSQGDDANKLTNPPWETLSSAPCTGTISGKVWHDKDESKTRSVVDLQPEPLLPGWQVALFEVGATTPQTTTTNSTVNDPKFGTYEFTGVVLNRSYVICTKKSNETWAQTTPTTPGTECSTYEPNGIVTGLFTASASPKINQDFGVVKTVAVNCTESDALLRTKTSADGSYTVRVSTTGCEKAGLLEYIFESYTAGSDQVATFRPELAAAGKKIALIEKRIWSIPNTQTSTLKYDDKADSVTGLYSREPMLYCTKDPRDGPDAGSALDTEFDIAVDPIDLAGVLPTSPPSPPREDDDPHTSCLISSLEQAGGVRTDYIFSYFDGNRWL